MSVEKMTMIGVSGPKSRFDEILMSHFMDNDFHPENVLQVLKDVKGLVPFNDVNPYNTAFKACQDVIKKTGLEKKELMKTPKENVSAEEAERYLYEASQKLSKIDSEIMALEREIADARMIVEQLSPVADLGVNLDELFNLKYIKLRFGRLKMDRYYKLETYLGDLEVIFIKVYEDSEHVWGFFFLPSQMKDKVDTVLSALYFERIKISDKAYGHPKDAYNYFKKRLDSLRLVIEESRRQKDAYIAKCYMKIGAIYQNITWLHSVFQARKYCAHTDSYFYLAGWMAETKAKKLKKILDLDDNLIFRMGLNASDDRISPPTLMKNARFFKPFEWFVDMYGLPNYNEVDPTKFLTITYIFMFGFMFGDVGHGLVLALLGAYFAFVKRASLGYIMLEAGIVSVFFGFMYGSIFGYEHIDALWLRPMGTSDNINTLLLLTVGLGVFLILFAMILNIINGIKQKNLGKICFDANGIAGMIFYLSFLALVMMKVVNTQVKVATWIMVLLIGVPLVLMLLKEPLVRIIKKKKSTLGESKGGFFIEAIFELFEILLSFITNTISFVRVGAFALIHVGMLTVVFIFADLMKSMVGNVAVVIIGNLIVIGLEGLIVGIQVLRLEFYELFSRFYTGNGKEFKALKAFED